MLNWTEIFLLNLTLRLRACCRCGSCSMVKDVNECGRCPPGTPNHRPDLYCPCGEKRDRCGDCNVPGSGQWDRSASQLSSYFSLKFPEHLYGSYLDCLVQEGGDGDVRPLSVKFFPIFLSSRKFLIRQGTVIRLQ